MHAPRDMFKASIIRFRVGAAHCIPNSLCGLGTTVIVPSSQKAYKIQRASCAASGKNYHAPYLILPVANASNYKHGSELEVPDSHCSHGSYRLRQKHFHTESFSNGCRHWPQLVVLYVRKMSWLFPQTDLPRHVRRCTIRVRTRWISDNSDRHTWFQRYSTQ